LDYFTYFSTNNIRKRAYVTPNSQRIEYSIVLNPMAIAKTSFLNELNAPEGTVRVAGFEGMIIICSQKLGQKEIIKQLKTFVEKADK